MSLSGRKCLFKILKLKTNINVNHIFAVHCAVFLYLLYHHFKCANSILLLIGCFAHVAYHYGQEKGGKGGVQEGRRAQAEG